MVLPGFDAVSPFLVLQFCFLGYAVVYWMKNGFAFERKWYWMLFFFTSFVAYSIISAFIFPILFDGIRVYSPRGGIDQQYVARGILQMSISNIALAVSLFLYWVQIVFILSNKKLNLTQVFEKGYFISALLVMFFAYYQLLNILTGVYFPKEYILNNQNYAVAGDASFGFLPRINATFTEPSFYAMFMSGFVAWIYVKFVNQEKYRNSLLWFGMVLLGIFSLIISASSTGYVSLFIFFICYSLKTTFFDNSGPARKRILTTISLIFLMLFFSYLFVPGVDAVVDTLVFDKGSSDSSLHRLASDTFAFTVLEETYYLGAGLGSNRPSSFFTFMISNIGIIGVVLALAAIIFLIILAGRGKRNEKNSAQLVSLQAAGWALFTMLVSKVLAGAELNFPSMWILICYYIAAVASMTNSKEEFLLR